MHSFTGCLVHCVWSTKNRETCLSADLRERLWPYLGGIAKRNQMKTLAIGGASDHVHILLSLPATSSVAKAMQLLMGNSSKWIRETFPKMHSFGWQEGYGAFSVGVSGLDATVAYIRNQAEHHRTQSFREGVCSDAQEARFCERRINLRLTNSVVPAGTQFIVNLFTQR